MVNETLVTEYVDGNVFHINVDVVCRDYDQARKLMENYGQRYRESIIDDSKFYQGDMAYRELHKEG